MNVPTASRLNRYLTVILRWLAITAIVFVLTLLGGFYITENLLHKVYTATAQIEMLPSGATPDSGLVEPPSQFQPEIKIMGSPDVLLPVIYDLGLDKAWAKRVHESGSEDLPPQDALLPQDALAYMNKILKFDYVRGTNIINITVSSDVPKEAADIANAIADRYKTMRDVEEDQRIHRGSDFLHDAIVQEQKIFDEKKAKVEKMLHDLGMDRPHTGPPDTAAQAELDARKKDLLAAQEDYNARRVLLKSVINLPDDQFISTLKGLGRDPKIASETTHPQIKELVVGLRHAMQVDTDTAKSRVDLLQKQVDDLTAKLRKDDTAQLVTFRDAQRQLEHEQDVLDDINARLKENVADRQLQESPVRIISRAEPPEYPSKPNRSFVFIVTVVVAGFLSLAAASFVEIILLFLRAAERTDN